MDNKNNKFFRAELTGNYILNINKKDDDTTILSNYCDEISDINCGTNMKNINVISYFRKTPRKLYLFSMDKLISQVNCFRI